MPIEMTDASAEWVREHRWVHRKDLRSFQEDESPPGAGGACDEWWHPASVDEHGGALYKVQASRARGTSLTRCRGVSYCSKDCQISRTGLHKASCVPR
jgi:hypothetical protein